VILHFKKKIYHDYSSYKFNSYNDINNNSSSYHDINNNSSSYDDINNKFNSSNYSNCNGLIRK
jgi:hypothetical protein